MKAILFDLDGSLLPMDQDGFVGRYFELLGQMMEGFGYDPKAAVKAVIAGTKAMTENDGSVTNEQAFWKVFTSFLGEDVRALEPKFHEFYMTEFEKASSFSEPSPTAGLIVEAALSKGYRVALATNPIFPKVATQARIRWAGLKSDDFELVSTYEDFRFSKPNLGYYRQFADLMALKPEECMMVGNDIWDDSVALEIGMDFFLLTNCLLNRAHSALDSYKKGTLEDFLHLLNRLPDARG